MTNERLIYHKINVLLFIIVILLVVIFHFLGNMADVHLFGRSSIVWMIIRWNDYGGRFSHCYMIPLVSIGIIWWKRKELTASIGKTSSFALFVIMAALLLQLISARSRLPRLSLLALVTLLWSIPWHLYGKEVARTLLFPCAYLLFCVPMTFLDSLTFPLRLFAASSSTFLLNGLGIEVVRAGTAIYSSQAGKFALDVVDPCSGLRYFLALTALTAAYAYVTQRTLIKKWLLFLAAIPLAVIANVVRIMVIAIIANAGGQDLASGICHDYSGYIVFVTAVALMIGVGALLNVDFRKRWDKWKNRDSHPITQ